MDQVVAYVIARRDDPNQLFAGWNSRHFANSLAPQWTQMDSPGIRRVAIYGDLEEARGALGELLRQKLELQADVRPLILGKAVQG